MDVRGELVDEGFEAALERLGVDGDDLGVVIAWRDALAGGVDGGRKDDLARIAVLVERLGRLVGHRELLDEVFEERDDHHELGEGVLPLFALALGAPAVRQAHRARGISEAVSDATLADLGMQVREHRRLTGRTGLSQHRWLCRPWADGYLKLGRLQFEIGASRLGVLAEPVPVMYVHVDRSGTLEPADVDDSLVTASTYLEEHYPEAAPLDWFVCVSWLLDPALAWGMGPTSNIADFCRRWTPFRVQDGVEDVLRFVFDVQAQHDGAGAPVVPLLDTLPADTRLRRVVLERWRAGEAPAVVRGKLPVISELLQPEA